MAQRYPWTPWHDRLHRQLLRQPDLLPKKACLLLAVSGGQDSIALLVLLNDLVRLHHWDLLVWHGDHSWHAGSTAIAQELTEWCGHRDLPILCNRAEVGSTRTEAAARQWRYGQLTKLAKQDGRDVVTGHTATDRAETLLLQMARGTDLTGLASLRPQRPLDAAHPDGPQLRRPLLGFSRDDTLAICLELNLPIWLDPSNENPIYARNRIRLAVLPVLEELHPGSTHRIAALAERVSQVRDTQQQLASIALETLRFGDGLDRRALGRLPAGTRRTLLANWLNQQGVKAIAATALDRLSHRLALGQPAGQCDLPDRCALVWQGETLWLKRHGSSHH